MVTRIVAMLALCAVLSGSCAGNEYGAISVQQAYRLIQEMKGNGAFRIIDCRSPREFAQSRIENAINMDISNDKFLSAYDGLARENVYLLYCRSGNKSSIVMKHMKEKGFQRVYDMSGGIVQWTRQGYPVVTGIENHSEN